MKRSRTIGEMLKINQRPESVTDRDVRVVHLSATDYWLLTTVYSFPA